MNDFVEVVDGKVIGASATILAISLEDIEGFHPQGITKPQWELVVSRLKDWVDAELQDQVVASLKWLS